MKKLTLTLLAAAALFSTTSALADDDRAYYEKNRASFISHDAAAKAAVAAVGGGRVKEVDFENKGSRAVFEVEILGNSGEWDVIVDAKTGKILSRTQDD
ncbi:MAG: PepSY domain-containing protein [Neisseria sp.]|nr:PepSY domain-containing protein [Neisseria sp.]